MSSKQTHDHLLVALRRILRPLARLLIRTGIRFNEFADLVGRVYVESAARDFDGTTIPSRARIASISGLTYRQVDQYVDCPLPSANPTSVDLLVEILHRWHTIPEYVGPYGVPRELEYESPPERCFRSLVALVDPAADPRTILEDLMRIGTVASASDGHLRAVSRSLLMSATASPQFIEHFGTTLSRLAATMEFNMDPRNTEKRLQRRVIADRGLPLSLVPAFERHARDRAMAFLLELDNWIATQATEGAADSDRIDAGVNVFLCVEPLEKEAPLAALASASEN